MDLMNSQQQETDIFEPVPTIDDATEQYLHFTLADENYWVEILRVQEIKVWEPVTSLPNSPSYLCGVLNLRGNIVPIVDLRLRFDMPAKEYHSETVVIILKVEGLTDRTVGVVVDSVSDTHSVSPDAIQSSPDLGEGVNTAFINGLVTLDEQMMMLLDIDLLLSIEALG